MLQGASIDTQQRLLTDNVYLHFSLVLRPLKFSKPRMMAFLRLYRYLLPPSLSIGTPGRVWRRMLRWRPSCAARGRLGSEKLTTFTKRRFFLWSTGGQLEGVPWILNAPFAFVGGTTPCTAWLPYNLRCGVVHASWSCCGGDAERSLPQGLHSAFEAETGTSTMLDDNHNMVDYQPHLHQCPQPLSSQW